MFCPNCGNEIPDGAKFCAKCGHQITPKPQQAGTQVAGTRAPGVQTSTPAAKLASHGKKPLVIGLVAVVAVIVVIAGVALTRCGGLGGVHWYEPASFLSADVDSQLKSLQDSGFECDDAGQWTCEAKDGPYEGVDVTIIAAEDQSGDNILDEDSSEDGDAARIMIIRCTSVDLGDVSGPKDAMEKAVNDFNLGSIEDTLTDGDYSAGWGKCKIDGKDGFWILAAEGDDDDWSVQIISTTLDASYFDSYDDIKNDLA